MVESKNYMKHLVEQANLHFIATGKVKETGQIITAMKVVTLHTPKLNIMVCNAFILAILKTFYTGWHQRFVTHPALCTMQKCISTTFFFQNYFF